MILDKVAEKLKEHNFNTMICQTKEEVINLVIDLVGRGSVGIGGSVTVDELGLYEKLTQAGNEVHWH